MTKKKGKSKRNLKVYSLEKTLKNPNLRTRSPFSSVDQPEGRGRPKGSLSLTNLLREHLTKNNYKEAKELIKAVSKNAKKGLPVCVNTVFNRIDGIQSQEIGPDDRPILVVLARGANKEPAE